VRGPAAQATATAQASSTASISTPPPATPGGSYLQFTVRPGDQWWAIARYFNITVCELQMANPQIKDPSHLEVGAVLNIPKPGQVKCVAASPT